MTQLTFTCSKSTIEKLEKGMKYGQSYQKKHQNDVGGGGVCERAALKNLGKFVGKHLWWSATLLKKISSFFKNGFHIRCFPVNFANCLTSVYKIKYGLDKDIFLLSLNCIVVFHIKKTVEKTFLLLLNSSLLFVTFLIQNI